MLAKGYVTPEDVLQLQRITNSMNLSFPIASLKPINHFLNIFIEYLCSPDANIYDVDFTRFCIRDLESGTVLFEIAKPSPSGNSNNNIFEIMFLKFYFS